MERPNLLISFIDVRSLGAMTIKLLRYTHTRIYVYNIILQINMSPNLYTHITLTAPPDLCIYMRMIQNLQMSRESAFPSNTFCTGLFFLRRNCPRPPPPPPRPSPTSHAKCHPGFPLLRHYTNWLDCAEINSISLCNSFSVTKKQA